MKNQKNLNRKLSVLCYEHKALDQCCIQCHKSWKEVCHFILNMGKKKIANNIIKSAAVCGTLRYNQFYRFWNQ